MDMANIEEEAPRVLTGFGVGPKHPRCIDCAVPMWLVKVEHTTQGEIRLYECKA